MQNRYLIILILILLNITVNAQKRFSVIDGNIGRPIEDAIISINGENIATDKNGIFLLDNNLSDSLYIFISHISYNTFTSTLGEIKENIILKSKYNLLDEVVVEEKTIESIFEDVRRKTINKLKNKYSADYYWQEKRYLNDSIIAYGDAIFTFAFSFRRMIPSSKKSRYIKQLRLNSSIDMRKIKKRSNRKQPSDRFIDPRIGASIFDLISKDYNIVQSSINDSIKVLRCILKDSEKDGDRWSEINIFINDESKVVSHTTLLLSTENYKSYYEFYYATTKENKLVVSEVNFHVSTQLKNNNRRNTYIKFKLLGLSEKLLDIDGIKTNKYVSPFMFNTNFNANFWEGIEGIEVPQQYK